MRVSGFIRAVLVLIGLFGLGFLGLGGWELWAAQRFAADARPLPGIFKGYHTVYHETTVTDSDGHSRPGRTEEALPMFSYTDDAGRTQAVTGRRGHPFRHLDRGQAVVVLVSREPSIPPRLGDLVSLYGGGGLTCAVGVAIVLLAVFGMRGVSAAVARGGIFQRMGDARLPVGGMALMLGGFVLLAGGVMVLAYFYALERNDPALIAAIAAGEADAALRLAMDCRGVDAKNTNDETALIAALVAGQPQLADAILDCTWVSASAVSRKGISAVGLAAGLGQPRLVARLLKKGASAMEVPPTMVHNLILAGDAATLQTIVESGFDMNPPYQYRTFGDLALIAQRPAIVRLIRDHGGRFTAAPAFLALALDDPAALRAALADPGARKRCFNGWTLTQYADTLGRTALLNDALATVPP